MSVFRPIHLMLTKRGAVKRRLSETGLRLTGKSWAYFRRTAEKMTSACSPGVDRIRLKVCWVESAREKQ